MATLKKIKFFGYADLITSMSQMLVTSVSTVVSLYYHFKNMKREGHTDAMSYFSPTFNLICAALVVYAHGGQVIAVRKLIKVAINGMYDEELIEARDNWACWNGASCIVSMIWYPLFGITMFHEYGWPLPYIGVSFVVIAGARVALTFVFYKMLDKEEDQIPPLDADMLEPPIEMHEIRHHGWL